MVYKYRDYERPVSADIMGKHIEKLQKENGEVTAMLLLDSARDENSVIHNCFEWDDSIAGEKYRIQQSRNILVNLIIEYETSDNQTEDVRAFINISKNSKETGRYIDFITAISDEESYNIMLKKALEELKAYERKYQQYIELRPIFEAIEKVKIAS